MLPRCSLSPFPPMVGTAWILHSAVGTWHADALQGLFLWAWALVSPAADSRQPPLIQAVAGGPGSSGKGRVEGWSQLLLIQQQSHVCDNKRNWGKIITAGLLATKHLQQTRFFLERRVLSSPSCISRHRELDLSICVVL